MAETDTPGGPERIRQPLRDSSRGGFFLPETRPPVANPGIAGSTAVRGRNQNIGEIKPKGDKPGKEHTMFEMSNFDIKGKRGKKRKGGRHSKR